MVSLSIVKATPRQPEGEGTSIQRQSVITECDEIFGEQISNIEGEGRSGAQSQRPGGDCSDGSCGCRERMPSTVVAPETMPVPSSVPPVATTTGPVPVAEPEVFVTVSFPPLTVVPPL